ncbi:MAG TPA: MerR family transcriptional regulator [Limnobacter sp.]|uniref:MerR family transcriptional regulator n=1 Tax=Limnobacter sp. TaxID=2003368 RepID=UPI002EDB169C
MKIGELSKLSGLSAATIRFYESKGLITAVSRQSNGYREYPPEAASILSIISSAQQTGFTLDEIRQVLPGDLSHWKHDELLSMLKKKVADIETLEAKLAQGKAQLNNMIALIEDKPADMDCDDNAKRILGNMGLLKAPRPAG